MEALTVLVYLVISIIFGLIAIGIATGLTWFSVTVPLLNNYTFVAQADNNISVRWMFFLGGAFIMLLAIRFTQLVFSRAHRDKALIFNTQHGPIHITLFALEDMIKKALVANVELSDIRPRVTSEKNELEIMIRTNIAADVNVLGVTKEVQGNIHEKLTQILGSDQPMRIKIEIRKMLLSKKKPSQKPETLPNNYVE
jgi:hypothetical protein